MVWWNQIDPKDTIVWINRHHIRCMLFCNASVNFKCLQVTIENILLAEVCSLLSLMITLHAFLLLVINSSVKDYCMAQMFYLKKKYIRIRWDCVHTTSAPVSIVLKSFNKIIFRYNYPLLIFNLTEVLKQMTSFNWSGTAGKSIILYHYSRIKALSA